LAHSLAPRAVACNPCQHSVVRLPQPRASLQKILPLNIGALFLSMLGLMMVVVGVILA